MLFAVVPMMTTPILIFSIVLVITSIALALLVLMHKGRGGGLSDLFGGGISSSLGGSSVAAAAVSGRVSVSVTVLLLSSGSAVKSPVTTCWFALVRADFR